MVNTRLLNQRIDGSGMKKAFIAEELGMTRQGMVLLAKTVANIITLEGADQTTARTVERI